MNDDIEVYLDGATTGASYLESLAKSRQYLSDSPLLAKLDAVIEAELELALLGTERARSEVLKTLSKDKDNLRPIK